MTPLSIRQEYLPPERSHTPIASRSLNGSSQCGTITVPPRPDGIPDQDETHHHSALPPAGSVRISEGDRTENDDRQGASGLGHAQSGFTRHESEVTPLLDLLDSPLDERLLGSPVLDPTPSDLNLEAGVTAKGKEKERRHSNRQDSGYPASTSAADSRDILPSPSPEASITAKGKERERRDSNVQDSGSPASTPVANLRGIDPTHTDINPEAGITAKGKEKERGYSNERDYNNTGYPASTSVASSRRIVPGPSPATSVTAKGKEKEKSNSNVQDSGNPASTSVAKLLGIDHSTLEEGKRQAAALLVLLNASRIIITSETNVDQLKAIEIQEDTLDETNYDNEPVSRPNCLHETTKTNTTPESQLPTTFTSSYSIFNDRS